MSRLCTAARGLCSWRERLANPNQQWVRGFSAFEAAVSWELVRNTPSGIPAPIETLLNHAFGSPVLGIGIPEHTVPLPGGNAASQNDLWGLVHTDAGLVSLTIEAKAREPFGNHTLAAWLGLGGAAAAPANRLNRWNAIYDNLPHPPGGPNTYGPIPYQLLHRCACAVIEARRFGLTRAACIVQAFNTPDHRFQEFAQFCGVIEIPAARNAIHGVEFDGITLAIGWADCPLATDAQIAAVV